MPQETPPKVELELISFCEEYFPMTLRLHHNKRPLQLIFTAWPQTITDAIFLAVINIGPAESPNKSKVSSCDLYHVSLRDTDGGFFILVNKTLPAFRWASKRGSDIIWEQLWKVTAEYPPLLASLKALQ